MKRNSFAALTIVLVFCAACQPAPATTPVTITATSTQEAPAVSSQPTLTATSTSTPTQVTGLPAEGLVAFYSDRDGNPEIYAMQADGSNLQRLTDDPGYDDSPSISPDGRKIIFLTARHDPQPHFPDLKYEIYIMDSDGSNPARLTNTEAAEDHPAWSPDGKKIIFDADYDGDGYVEIYTMNPYGSELTRLTFNPANDQFADWSPDGLQIAFSSFRNGNWDIYVMNADGSDQRALTDSPDWELFPAWSPDGKSIAFTGLVPASRNTDVYVMQADGSGLTQLTDAPGFDENPDWSPGGDQIIFQTRRDGNFELYMMNSDGSQQRPLAAYRADDLWPSWEPLSRSEAPVANFPLDKSPQEFGIRETYQVALGDLDRDGDLDALFANPMRNDAQVWLNDGAGAFVDSGQRLTQYGHGAGLADFDGDGDLDAFIVCHQFSLPSRIYRNDGSGIFTDSGQDFGDATVSAADLNLLDLNGDGAMDVHVLYFAVPGIPDRVYLNDGRAVFHDSGLALGEDFIAWGDLDGDGDADYFGKTWQVGYVVMLNDGSGQLTRGWEMADSQAIVGDVGLADFDGDGDLDALIANGSKETGSQPGRLLWNDGSGRFVDSGMVLFETMGASFAIGDLDLDGDLDVFIANIGLPNELWLYQNGQFLDSGLRLGDPADMSGRATLGDLDGDGDLDLFVGRFNGGPEIWFNHIK